MSKAEFLLKLRESLENDVDQSVVRDNVDYYGSYIDGEIRNGRSEAEVLGELGDPWVIAQSIIDMEEVKGEQHSSKEYYEDGNDRSETTERSPFGSVTYKEVPRWKLALIAVGVIGVILMIFAVIGGIIGILAPVLIPVLVVAFVLRRFVGRR